MALLLWAKCANIATCLCADETFRGKPSSTGTRCPDFAHADGELSNKTALGSLSRVPRRGFINTHHVINSNRISREKPTDWRMQTTSRKVSHHSKYRNRSGELTNYNVEGSKTRRPKNDLSKPPTMPHRLPLPDSRYIVSSHPFFSVWPTHAPISLDKQTLPGFSGSKHHCHHRRKFSRCRLAKLARWAFRCAVLLPNITISF